MKKLLIFLVLLSGIAVSVSAVSTSARFGAILDVGFVDSPSISDIINEIDRGINFKPGFEFAMKIDRIGFGLNSFIMFNRTKSINSELLWDWTFDWIGTLNIGYHLARTWYFLDPFIEAGLGAAGRVDLTPQQDSSDEWGYIEADYYGYDSYNRLLNLSLVGYIAAGLSLRIDMLYVSCKLSYWPLNSPPPATQFMPYPVKQFQFAISAGFVIGK